MDFNDTEEERAFRAEARAWLEANAPLKDERAKKKLPSLAGEGDDTDVIPLAKQWQARLADARWTAIGWPAEYGGRDAPPNFGFVLGQEMGDYDIPTQVFAIGVGMIGPTLITHGTQEQKDRYLRPLLRGEEVWCQLWSEPNAGSDLAGLQMRAVRDDASGDWVLNGQKVWTTGAHYADLGLCVARTDPDLPKHQGITCFIVDMRAHGVEVRPLRQLTGGANFNEVFFSDVTVPADAVVGTVNGGWGVATTTLMNERFALLGGMASGSLDALFDLFRDGEVLGRPARDDRVVGQRIADVVVTSRLMGLTGFRALTKIMKGQIPGPEGSILKLVAAGLISDYTALGLDMLGPRGLLWGETAPDDGAWPVAYLAAPGMHLGGGTDEVMRNIIGERVLGLPKEPSVDRGVPFRELTVGTVAG